MNSTKYVYAWLVFAILSGCATGPDLPNSTRTGKIHDIKIGDTLNPKRLEVRPGDEVRWVNGRNGAVKITFIELTEDRVSCQKNFKSGWFKAMFSKEAGRIDTATVNGNDYISLCFAAPGMYTYNARMEAMVPGGEAHDSGKIIVE